MTGHRFNRLMPRKTSLRWVYHLGQDARQAAARRRAVDSKYAQFAKLVVDQSVRTSAKGVKKAGQFPT
jgi:hypothetical protein